MGSSKRGTSKKVTAKTAGKSGVHKKRKGQKFRDADSRDQLDKADIVALSGAPRSKELSKAFQTQLKSQIQNTKIANDDLLKQLDIMEKFEL
jgi:hypothetical protein